MQTQNSENHRNLRTPRSHLVKNGRVPRSRAGKRSLTHTPWTPSELSDPISDSGCKSPPCRGESKHGRVLSKFLAVQACQVAQHR